jgi:O-antigen ligase
MTKFVTSLTENSTSPTVDVAVLVGIGVLVAGSPFGNGATHPAFFAAYRLLIIVLTVLCGWGAAGREGPDLAGRIRWGGAAVLLLMLAGVWASPGQNPAGTTLWYEHLLFALFFLTLARFAARRSAAWRRCGLGLVAGAALIHLALAQIPGWFEIASASPFGNANYLGTYLLTGFGITLAAGLYGSSTIWRIGGGLAALTLFGGITATLSRGATLAAVVVVGIAVLKLGRREIVIGTGAIMLTGAVVIVLANPGLMRKFTDRGELDPYNYQRTAIWTSSARMMASYPVLGVGLSRYDDVARRFRPPVEDTVARYMKRQAIAHSEYIQYGVEAGVLAGLLIIALVGSLLWSIWRTSPEPGSRAIEWGALLAGAGVGAHAAVDNVFQVPVALATIAAVAMASGPLSARSTPLFPRSRAGFVAMATCAVLVFLLSSGVPAVAYGLNRTSTAYLADGDIRRAERSGRLAVAALADDAVLLHNLGNVYAEEFRRIGDLHLLDLADAYFQRSAQANPDWIEPRLSHADNLLDRMNAGPISLYLHTEFARANEAILELDPFLPLVGMNLAEAYFRSGRFDDAIAQLDRVTTIEPNFVPGYLTLAQWYAVAGRLEDSQAARQRALNIVDEFQNRPAQNDYEAALLGRPVGGGTP